MVCENCVSAVRTNAYGRGLFCKRFGGPCGEGGCQFGVEAGKEEPRLINDEKPIKPITNADRLNAMTNEEKAEWLAMVERRVIENALTKPLKYTDEQLKADWLEWLRKRADE